MDGSKRKAGAETEIQDKSTEPQTNETPNRLKPEKVKRET
jgi:hypothetical protein